MSETEVTVAVTGTAWMGAGVGSIQSALNKMFSSARDEISMTAYALGIGGDSVVEWIENALSRGVRVRLVVNRFDEQPGQVTAELRRLRTEHAHFELFDFAEGENADLHAKAVVADRHDAVVGSSNLSRRGFVDNHELALVVRGTAASTVATVLDRLFASSSVRAVI